MYNPIMSRNSDLPSLEGVAAGKLCGSKKLLNNFRSVTEDVHTLWHIRWVQSDVARVEKLESQKSQNF